jgi:hypothetical protein
LGAELTSRLSAIHIAVTTSLTLELHPTRFDQRQFVTWHAGPVPPLYVFDRASAARQLGKADIDSPLDMRAHVTSVKWVDGVTLRSSMPLYRLPPSISAAVPRKQLPSYRVVIEAYPALDSACDVGFVHDQTGVDTADPNVDLRAILTVRGWWFSVHAEQSFTPNRDPAYQAWVVMAPNGATGVPATNMSSYATTDIIPPLRAGGAVELAVDYAAGTCLVAFYTPEAVQGGFATAPFATMELRFVATEKFDKYAPNSPFPHYDIAARPVPTETNATPQLYPAVSTNGPGAIWRFV